jgi:excisionase family DNA binding protein
MEPIYYSRHDVARILGLSVRSVDHLLSTGQLRSSKLGRRRMVHRETIRIFAGREVNYVLAG